MKCGYKGCKCEMKPKNPFSNTYPKNYECPKCHTTAIMKKGGCCERYDLDGKLYTPEINE